MKKIFLNYKTYIHLFFVIACLAFFIPLVYVISLSLTSEEAIRLEGYKLIPRVIDFEAYKHVFENPGRLIDAYVVTIFTSVVGALASLFVMVCAAYALSRKQFAQRNVLTLFIFFTMLFSGGLIPSYIVNTRFLNLGDSLWIYILPSLASAYYILILRTFLKTIPESLVESAKLDGAKEITILVKIMLPLSKPALATVLLLLLLGMWNDWQTSLLYIRNERLFKLQYLLQRILREDEFIRQMSEESSLMVDLSETKSAPTEGIRFAMAVLAAGPMLVVFPFFQKYFTRGLTVGAVKG